MSKQKLTELSRTTYSASTGGTISAPNQAEQPSGVDLN